MGASAQPRRSTKWANAAAPRPAGEAAWPGGLVPDLAAQRGEDGHDAGRLPPALQADVLLDVAQRGVTAQQAEEALLVLGRRVDAPHLVVARGAGQRAGDGLMVVA